MNSTIGKRERTKQLNRQTILKAAREVFLETGYEGCNVRDIIRRTGLAAGTFYNYYPDKLSVFKALLDDFIIGLNEKIHAVREQALSLEGFVSESYLIFYQGIAADPVSYELSRRNEAVIGNIYESGMMETVQSILKQDIEEAINRKALPPVDAGYLTAAFIGVAMTVGRHMTDSEPMDPEQAAQFSAKLFIGGIKELAGQHES